MNTKLYPRVLLFEGHHERAMEPASNGMALYALWGAFRVVSCTLKV